MWERHSVRAQLSNQIVPARRPRQVTKPRDVCRGDLARVEKLLPGYCLMRRRLGWHVCRLAPCLSAWS